MEGGSQKIKIPVRWAFRIQRRRQEKRACGDLEIKGGVMRKRVRGLIRGVSRVLPGHLENAEAQVISQGLEERGRHV